MLLTCFFTAISGGPAVSGGPDIDRLALAEYNVTDGSNEVFAIDDLGNRDMGNVPDGNKVDYVIDANTNVLAVCEPPLRRTGKPRSKNAPDTLNFLRPSQILSMTAHLSTGDMAAHSGSTARVRTVSMRMANTP